MLRPLILSLAFIAAPAFAAPMYEATLATPMQTSVMVRDAQWKCTGASCSAPRTATSSDATVCSAVVRKLGPVTAFASNGAAFDADKLQKCNAAAR